MPLNGLYLSYKHYFYCLNASLKLYNKTNFITIIIIYLFKAGIHMKVAIRVNLSLLSIKK